MDFYDFCHSIGLVCSRAMGPKCCKNQRNFYDFCHSIGLVCGSAMGPKWCKNQWIFMIFVIRWAWFAASPWAQTAVKTNGFPWFLSFDGPGLRQGHGHKMLWKPMDLYDFCHSMGLVCSKAMGPKCLKKQWIFMIVAFDWLGLQQGHEQYNAAKTNGFDPLYGWC